MATLNEHINYHIILFKMRQLFLKDVKKGVHLMLPLQSGAY